MAAPVINTVYFKWLQAMLNSVIYSPDFVHPITGKPLRLDCFAVIQDMQQLNEDAFGLTYNDFDAGLFWARRWVASGANISTLQKQYPALVVLPISSSIVKDSPVTVRHEISLTVVMCNNCSACPDEMPQEVAYAKAIEMLSWASAQCEFIAKVGDEWHGESSYMFLTGEDVTSAGDLLAYTSGKTFEEAKILRDNVGSDGCIRVTTTLFVEDCYQFPISMDSGVDATHRHGETLVK